MGNKDFKQVLYSFISWLWPMIRKHFSLYRDGYLWFGFTCLFALLFPAMLKLAIPSFKYPWENFFLEGDIVLFSMVIVTSLVIDNFVFEEDFLALLKTEGLSSFRKRFLLFIFPMLAIMSCLTIYLRCQSLKEKTDPSTIVMEILIFIAVAAYAAFVKHASWDKNSSC